MESATLAIARTGINDDGATWPELDHLWPSCHWDSAAGVRSVPTMARHRVAVVVPGDFALFELGVAVEVFAHPRPELEREWYDVRVCAAEGGERGSRSRSSAQHRALNSGGPTDAGFTLRIQRPRPPG